MSIDGIGKRPLAGAIGTESLQQPREVGAREEFRAERPVAPMAVDATSAISRVRSGEISVDAYLDAKVASATAHLEGLSASQIDTVRQLLRAQLATDPLLVDLVHAATGSVPPASDE